MSRRDEISEDADQVDAIHLVVSEVAQLVSSLVVLLMRQLRLGDGLIFRLLNVVTVEHEHA